MDVPDQHTSLEAMLQNHQVAVDELYIAYQKIINRLTTLIQELPAEILMEADHFENNPPNSLYRDEVVLFANGMRLAASRVIVAINAKMIFEQAELDGELDARKNMDDNDS